MDKIKVQIVNELHKPARKFFPRRLVFLKGIDDLWQGDLIDLQAYSKDNNGFKYILVVIDCFSKYAWGCALKSKSGPDVGQAFINILENSCNRRPKNLQTDQGKEFYNIHFKKIMTKNNINHYSTFSNIKACIVERFIRTFKQLLFKTFSLEGSYKWINIYKQILENYNKRKHRTIQMRPIDVKGSKQESLLLQKVYRKHFTDGGKKPKFRVGDYVRISKYRNAFSKSYLPLWTTEIFRVDKVRKTMPVVYYLKDYDNKNIEGCFYEPELQRVVYPNHYLIEKIIKRRKNGDAFVKWLHLPDSHSSWVKLPTIKKQVR